MPSRSLNLSTQPDKHEVTAAIVDNMLDVTCGPGVVEVKVEALRKTGVLYVHINGVTLLRINRIPDGTLVLEASAPA